MMDHLLSVLRPQLKAHWHALKDAVQQPRAACAGADGACGTAPTDVDSWREDAIRRAGNAMEASYRVFCLTGDEAALDRAHRHMEQMRELVTARRPEFVQYLEQQRGLA